MHVYVVSAHLLFDAVDGLESNLICEEIHKQIQTDDSDNNDYDVHVDPFEDIDELDCISDKNN